MTTTTGVTAQQAADYLEYVTPFSVQFFPAFFKLASVQPGERVLDLACGPGDTTLEAAARAGAQGEVLGIDIAPEMIAIARRRALEAGITNVRFEVMDACALDLRASYWDVVLCHLGVTEFEDLPAALKEMLRVLRPVGRIAVSTWGEASRSPWLAVPFDAVHSFWPARPAASGSRPFRYGEPGVLSRVLADAEFSDVTPDRTTASLEYVEFADYWQAVDRGLAYGPAPLAGLTPEQRLQAEAAGEPTLRKWRNFRTKHLHVGAQAFLAVAVK